MLSKEILNECLESGKYYCLQTNQVVEEKPKNRAVYDSESFPNLFDLVASGDCYPGKYAVVFGKSPESFTAWIKTYADKNGLERISIRDVYAKEIREATEATCMDRYNCRHNWAKGPLRDELEAKWLEELGATSPLGSPKIQAMIEATNMHNLGVRRPFQSPVIQQKVVDSVMDEYKVKTTLLEPNTMAKIKATNQANLGVDYPFQSDKIQQMCRESIDLEEYGIGDPWVDSSLDGDILKAPGKPLTLPNGEINRFAEMRKIVLGLKPKDYVYDLGYCPARELELSKKLGIKDDTNYSTELKLSKNLNELGCNELKYSSNPNKFANCRDLDYVQNARKLHGVKFNKLYYDMDFYFPKLKLGIEVNGLQNHSVNAKAMGKGGTTPVDYHFNKFKKFHDNGILMISFTDHEQERFEEIYCNLIKYHLKLVSIDELRASITPEFLEFNGIESIEQSLNYGLFDSSKLTDDFENHKHQRFIKQYEYWDCGVIKH